MSKCTKDTEDYIDPGHADRLRVFADYEGYGIDAACAHGGYTEALWTHDGATSEPIATLARAVELAQAFAREVTPHLVGTKPKVNAAELFAAAVIHEEST